MVKKVVIVGAGPSGVLLAHYLLRRGEQYQIEVYDRLGDPRLVEFSTVRTYSITLTDRGMNALGQIPGVEAAVRAISLEMQGSVFHGKNGKTRMTTRKKPLMALDRTQLVIALLQKLTEKYDNSRLNLYFNYSCTEVDFAAKTVTFQTPEPTDAFLTVNYDVLIGADGARSTVRSALSAADERPHLLNIEPFEVEQKYVSSAYKSIVLPPDSLSDSDLESGRIHSWRINDGTVVLLLHQRDGSMNGVLLSPPNNAVADLATSEAVLQFFRKHFPEIGRRLPVSEAEVFLKRSFSRVLTVRCNRYHHGDSVLILGDAAHAVSPSLGQGCNAALEDVTIVDELLNEYSDDWATAIPKFTVRRKADAHALAELSDYVYPDSTRLFIELAIRQRFAQILHQLSPRRFAPPITQLVSETSVPYSEILQFYKGWIAKVKQSKQQI